jgi:hypothetical protein
MKTASGEFASMAAMMAPALMVSAAAAPSIMVTPATAAHVMAVPVLDLNDRIMLRAKRRDSHSGGCGCGHGQQQCATNQCNASHAVFLPSHDCDIAYNFPIARLFHSRRNARGVG